MTLKQVRFSEISETYFYKNGYSIDDHKYWMQEGMDRQRFQDRINKINKLVKPILLKFLNKINN